MGGGATMTNVGSVQILCNSSGYPIATDLEQFNSVVSPNIDHSYGQLVAMNQSTYQSLANCCSRA